MQEETTDDCVACEQGMTRPTPSLLQSMPGMTRYSGAVAVTYSVHKRAEEMWTKILCAAVVLREQHCRPCDVTLNPKTLNPTALVTHCACACVQVWTEEDWSRAEGCEAYAKSKTLAEQVVFLCVHVLSRNTARGCAHTLETPNPPKPYALNPTPYTLHPTP